MKMTRPEVLDAMRRLLQLVDENASSDTERALLVALDRIAFAYYSADCDFDERDHPDPTRADYKLVRERITQRFPGLGLYRDQLPLSDTEQSIGDAVDDLADIT